MKFYFILVLALSCTLLSAQKYTYLGGGMGLISTRYQIVDFPLQPQSGSFLTGGFYDVNIRQQITRSLSIKIGVNAGGYVPEIELPTGQQISVYVGLSSHQIPINIEIEADVFKDRISSYASFGAKLAQLSRTGNGSFSNYYSDGLMAYIEWEPIPQAKLSVLYSAGFGSRFRVVDELIFNLETGYVFGFEDLRTYHITYEDQSGNSLTENINIKGAYWQLKFGFSYPIQRATELIRGAVGNIKSVLMPYE